MDIKEKLQKNLKERERLLSQLEGGYIIKHIEVNCPFVKKIKRQLTIEEENKLLENYLVVDIINVVDAMDNKFGIEKKYTTVYKTCLNWLKMRDSGSLNDFHDPLA